jgi:glycosyltransferase involved in cell wall biosynthesis
MMPATGRPISRPKGSRSWRSADGPDFGRRWAGAIADVVRAHDRAVLHCHQYTPFVYGALAAGLTGAGLVFTEHGRLSDAPPSLKRRVVNPVLGRSGAAIFAVSDHLREHMVAEGLPPRRITVIHNGIDPGPEPTAETRDRARAALGVARGTFVIGTAARLDPVKISRRCSRRLRSFERPRRRHTS